MAVSLPRFWTSVLTEIDNLGNLRAQSASKAGNESWAFISDDMPWRDE